MSMNILITGSEGYIGSRLTEVLSQHHRVFGIDIRETSPSTYHYTRMDIRDPLLADLIRDKQITHVIHLASIVSPGADPERDFDIDINGTRNLLKACVAHNVGHITVTSSGAAYGYYADNPAWLKETDTLRGNASFSYSYHKRLIEEMLKDYRVKAPQLKQLILRPGTVLGKHTDNMITNLFRKNRLLAIQGSASPFVFIWDEDVVNILRSGCENSISGIFNLAGDGAMTIQEIAAVLGKKNLTLPAWLLKSALFIGKSARLTQYGPEQLDFLRYRPVLDNTALKNVFGFRPQKSSREVFEYYASQQGLLP
ncbi:MAG: epimerase [Oceanospirillaceae bacterium]|nr:epimerase [Oceanospirillaceae bacterium]MBT10836.1 epimerase [Oceanospirillaceae bacterium]